jgi:hypothetical protein
MRADVPGTEHWIDYRSPESLTIGDIDAYNEPIEEIWAQRATASSDEDEMELSGDGVSMTPKPKPPIVITVATIRARRDALLSRTITGWSFTDVPLPYGPESRTTLPVAALPLLQKAYNSLTAAIDELDGPKDQTAPTGGSATTSPATSASGLPDLTPEPSATAGG